MEFPSLDRLHCEPDCVKGMGQFKNWLKTEKSASLESKWVRRTDTWAWRADVWFFWHFFQKHPEEPLLCGPLFCYICLESGHISQSYFSTAVKLWQKPWWSVLFTGDIFTACVRLEAMSADRLSRMSKEVKPESVSLCPLGAAAAPEQELLCIFGTGDFGRSLGQRLLQTGYRVVYGSRRPHSCAPLPQGAQVQHIAWHLKLLS